MATWTRRVVALIGVVAWVLAGLALPSYAVPTVAPAAPAAHTSIVTAAEDEPIDIYFYWQIGCPHCEAADPVLEQIAAAHPEVRLIKREISQNPDNLREMVETGERNGVPATGTPYIVVGDMVWVGWRDGNGFEIEQVVQQCIDEGCSDSPDMQRRNTLDLPLVGDVDLSNRSLLVSTVLIALVDGVNPCSMWVLTVLIALALRTRSRKRTLAIGLTFIFVTGLVYAAFILGLVTVMTFLGLSWWIKAIVAAVAGFLGLVSIKDYFWFKRGLSFSIPESQKPGIIARMRTVVRNSDSVLPLLGATIVLSVGVSLVEFGCTAGFPVLWTNLVRTQQAEPGTIGALLLLYMLIYQLDELVLFLIAVVTMRAIRLQEKEGRALKLYAGVLMLTLAVVMLVDETLMGSVTGALIVFGGAILLATAVLVVHRSLAQEPAAR